MKYVRIKSRFFLLICGLLLGIYPYNLTCGADFDQLRKNTAEIKTIQASFIQKKIMKILSKPLVSEGKFYFAVPDSVRWEYLKPIKSVVIAHKGETKRYIYSGGKMVEDQTGGVQAMKIVLNEISSWMNGNFDQNPSFKATLKDKAHATQIILTPVGKNMEGMIEQIVITLSSKEKAVKSVNIIENINAQTIIDFNNTIINKALTESIFQDVE